MKKIMLLIMFLPLITFAQKSKLPVKQTSTMINTKGWRDLDWGASPISVKAKYNTSAYDPKDRWCILENYEIASKIFKVIFHFDINNQLESVVLTRYHFYLANETKFRFEVAEEISSLQKEIEIGVTSKFGPPSITSNSPNYIRVWNFPNLKIEINSSIIYQPKLANDGLTIDENQSENDLVSNDNFSLEYSKPNKTDMNKF
jgi:hypothetical protein